MWRVLMILRRAPLWCTSVIATGDPAAWRTLPARSPGACKKPLQGGRAFFRKMPMPECGARAPPGPVPPILDAYQPFNDKDACAIDDRLPSACLRNVAQKAERINNLLHTRTTRPVKGRVWRGCMATRKPSAFCGVRCSSPGCCVSRRHPAPAKNTARTCPALRPISRRRRAVPFFG